MVKRWRSVVPGLLPYSALATGTMSSQSFIRLLLVEASSVLSSAFVYEGQSISQRSGAPGRFQAAGPEAVSSRNSLAALSATASVQAPQPVQRVQGRRAFVLRGRRCRPRALSSGRAGGGKQPQFTCGVKRNASVQAPQPVQRVQGRRAFVLRGRRCRPRALSGGRVARAAQAEFTSAVSKARSVQAPCPYSATSADGQSWYTGEGMKQVQRERIRQEDGRIVTVLPGHGRL